MKRAVLYAIVLLGLSTQLVQCVATQKDMEYTNVRVRKMDSKVEDIDKEIDQLKKQTVQQVQERQAMTGDRLEYLQSEILKLQGQIDENNFVIRQVKEENKELKKLLLSRLETSDQAKSEELNKLNSRLAATEEQLYKSQERASYAENEIKAIKEARSQEASARAMEAAQRAREAEKKVQAVQKESSRGPQEIQPNAYKVDVSSKNITEASAEEKENVKIEPKAEQKVEQKVEPVAEQKIEPVAEQKAEPVVEQKAEPVVEQKVEPAVEQKVEQKVAAKTETSAATSFDQGMGLFKQKKFREAYHSFAGYLDKNPKGSQAVDARFYAAESLYEERDYELAILEFQKVIVEHPQHPLASKALYRQGLSFEKIGDPETARIVYNKLVDTYPKSDEVAPAKNRLEELKK